MHCKDCALVTSSGHLLGSQQGPQIDQTECVIRMNDAPTRGYGPDVGNRTSLRVIAHSSIQRILRNRHDLLNVSQGTVFIFWGPSSYMRRDGKGQVYNNLQLLSQVLPRLKAFMTTRHKMLQFDELFKQETGKDRYGAQDGSQAGPVRMCAGDRRGKSKALDEGLCCGPHSVVGPTVHAVSLDGPHMLGCPGNRLKLSASGSDVMHSDHF
ncbi:ST6 (alpha-N-acetyl-neuraminyl-23-beta-galactosyl-13)-N-acetylgalactosaminide alpha-26-sialyltransferase 5 [Cricetulus griseus]